MSKVKQGKSIDTIFVLIVFSIFAFSVLMVLMLGASIYRNINDISREGESERTVLSYIRTKTKNFDDADSIYISTFNNVPALYITEKIGDTNYNTIIYGYNGWLYELFSEESLSFAPADGVKIIQVEDLHFRDADHGLIEIATKQMSLLLYPRGDLEIPLGGKVR